MSQLISKFQNVTNPTNPINVTQEDPNERLKGDEKKVKWLENKLKKKEELINEQEQMIRIKTKMFQETIAEITANFSKEIEARTIQLENKKRELNEVVPKMKGQEQETERDTQLKNEMKLRQRDVNREREVGELTMENKKLKEKIIEKNKRENEMKEEIALDKQKIQEAVFKIEKLEKIHEEESKEIKRLRMIIAQKDDVLKNKGPTKLVTGSIAGLKTLKIVF